MMDNERRADIGAMVIMTGARETNVHTQEDAPTAITDVLAYVAHFCDRLGLDAQLMFHNGLRSYIGDFEDGPRADHTLSPEQTMLELAA